MFKSRIESRWLIRLLDVALRRPRRVLVCWAGLLLLGIVGVSGIRIDTSTNSFLDVNDPAWEIYQSSLAQYGGDEFVVVALRADEPWSQAGLAEVRRLSDKLERIGGVRRVDSLASVPLIRVAGDGVLRLDSGLADGVPATPSELSQYLEWLGKDRLAPDSLVSGDGRVFALNVLLDEEVVGDRTAVVREIRAEVGNQDAWITGVPIFRTEVNSHTLEQVLIFVPLTLLLLSLVLKLSFRGPQAIVVALATGGVAAICALGAMGASGIPLSLTTTILPSLVLALGCAYSMHILTAASGEGVCSDRLRHRLEPVIRPIAFSGLTTVIGFLAMSTIPVAAIRELATYGAFGVFVATGAALSLAPSILVVWPMTTGEMPLGRWVKGPVRRAIVKTSIGRRRAVFTAWIVIGVLGGAGLVRLFYATDIIQWFPRGSEVREDYESIKDSLSGITPVNVLIGASRGDRTPTNIAEPRVLAAIEALADDLRQQKGVGKVVSVVDPLRQIHAVLTGDSAVGLPADQRAINQYLLLLESVSRMQDVVRADHAGANILVRLNDNASSRIVEIGEWVESWWKRNGLGELSVATTGIMYEFGRAEEEIARGQVTGLLLAFSVVGLILLGVFRDWRVAAYGLFVNAIPLGLVYGVLGWAGVGLDAATACIGSTALGIGVDDTIHVVWSYREHREEGKSPHAALDGCLVRVLPALVFTTVTIGIGFVVLVLSPFTLLVHVGWVTTSIVGLCLLADASLLPALLVRDETRR